MEDVYDRPDDGTDEGEVTYRPSVNYVNVRPSSSKIQQHYESYDSALTVAPAKTKPAERKRVTSCKVFAITAILLEIVITVIVVVISTKVQETSHEPGVNFLQASATLGFPTTCLDLKDGGQTKSGYYVLQPNKNELPFSTYCDMETSGGGWTLIASVHENDINGKCKTADNWFSNDEGWTNGEVSRNWENKNTFGHANQATSNDYKNAGYYSIEASDVLIRHVPNVVDVNFSKQKAFLEYHTENKFLKSYGGNLYGVYKQYNLSTPYPVETFITDKTNEMLDALKANADYIISEIPNFYRYQYDISNTSNSLNNGGRDLFSDYGMRIYCSPCGFYVTYGTSQICSTYNDVVVASRRSTPFFALMGIGNVQSTRSYFYFSVGSTRFSSDVVEVYTGTLTNGDFTLQYNARCRYTNTLIPSICDIFYAVSNPKKWKSSIFIFNQRYISNDTTYYSFNQEVTMTPQNVVFGYTMFSRLNGILINQSNIEQALTKMLSIFAAFSSIAKSCLELFEPGLVQPITYTIDNPTAVLQAIPSVFLNDVTTGYMQFWTRNSDGTSFAFCPAIKVNTCQVESLCVGGVHKQGFTNRYCSDYTNWNNGRSTANLNKNNPGSQWRSKRYIESTILMFYR